MSPLHCTNRSASPFLLCTQACEGGAFVRLYGRNRRQRWAVLQKHVVKHGQRFVRKQRVQVGGNIATRDSGGRAVGRQGHRLGLGPVTGTNARHREEDADTTLLHTLLASGPGPPNACHRVGMLTALGPCPSVPFPSPPYHEVGLVADGRAEVRGGPDHDGVQRALDVNVRLGEAHEGGCRTTGVSPGPGELSYSIGFVRGVPGSMAARHGQGQLSGRRTCRTLDGRYGRRGGGLPLHRRNPRT